VPWVGNVRIGNHKEWFSLEHLNSHKALEFLERSYLFDLTPVSRFNNGRSPGISVFRTWLDERVFTGVGVYKNTQTLIGFNSGDGQYAVTGRVAALPVWNPDERTFWHVGGAMSHRDPVNGVVPVSIRDNVRNAPIPLLNLLINTGNIGASSQNLYNLETAFVSGPLTFEAEYTANVIHGAQVGTGPPQGSLYFYGYYAQVLWLLTGESRGFNRGAFALNRVIPKRPLWFKRGADCGEGSGYGAWEVGVRYSHVDVTNKLIGRACSTRSRSG
jgi:phosphate-selective porin OprO/OprP